MGTPHEALVAWRSVVDAGAAVTPVAWATNPVWTVSSAAGEGWVLKQLPEHDPGADRDTEYAVLRHLASHRVVVPLPVPTDAGAILAHHDDRRWQLLPRLPGATEGRWSGRPRDRATARVVGAAIGALDLALAEYPNAVDSFVDDPVASLPGIVADLDQDLTRLVRPFLSTVEAACADLPAQLTHGDCNDGNVLVDPGGGIGFLDLDHLPRGPRIRDLAYYLASRVRRRFLETGSGRVVPPTEEIADVLPHYVGGYHHSHPLTNREREAVVPLLLLIEIGGAHWALHGWQPDPDRYRRIVATLEWICARFDPLVAAAAEA